MKLLSSDGTWKYVCGVYDGSLGSNNIKLYINGALQNTTGAYTSAITSSTDELALGANATLRAAATSGYFTGSVGAIHIYDAAISANDVSQNCNAQKANYNVSCVP